MYQGVEAILFHVNIRFHVNKNDNCSPEQKR
jgi:hypothetical protein